MYLFQNARYFGSIDVFRVVMKLTVIAITDYIFIWHLVYYK